MDNATRYQLHPHRTRHRRVWQTGQMEPHYHHKPRRIPAANAAANFHTSTFPLQTQQTTQRIKTINNPVNFMFRLLPRLEFGFWTFFKWMFVALTAGFLLGYIFGVFNFGSTIWNIISGQ